MDCSSHDQRVEATVAFLVENASTLSSDLVDLYDTWFKNIHVYHGVYKVAFTNKLRSRMSDTLRRVVADNLKLSVEDSLSTFSDELVADVVTSLVNKTLGET